MKVIYSGYGLDRLPFWAVVSSGLRRLYDYPGYYLIDHAFMNPTSTSTSCYLGLSRINSKTMVCGYGCHALTINGCIALQTTKGSFILEVYYVRPRYIALFVVLGQLLVMDNILRKELRQELL